MTDRDDTGRAHARHDEAHRARPDHCPDCRAPLWPDTTEPGAWTCLACGYSPLRLI